MTRCMRVPLPRWKHVVERTIGLYFVGKVISWAERGAEGERIGCVLRLGEVDVVLGLEVGVMRRLLWDDGAGEDDEGDES